MESKWFKEYEYLKKSIDEGKSYEELGREYGCSGSNIKKVALRIGITLPQKREINPNETFGKKLRTCLNCGNTFYASYGFSNKFCCHECSCEYKHKEAYKYFLEHPEEFQRANYTPQAFKDIMLKEQDNKCAICNNPPEWNGKKLTFILDHIDGHASNNKRENLRLICPNCDSQLDTYKSKNKNGDRYYYRYKK